MPALYVLRHGETEWNAEGRIQGRSDSVLTDRGRAQAEAQGQVISRILGDASDLRVLVSPLRRTMETAEIALGPKFGAAVFDERLVEVGLGSWEGHLRSELARTYPVLADPDLGTFEQCFHAPGGESFDELKDRIADFLADLDGPSVVITHGVAGAVLRGLAMGLDRRGMAALDHRQGVVLRVVDGSEALLLG